MCKQKALTIAIASALVAGSGAVSAVDQFRNGYVGMTPTIHDSSTAPMKPVESLTTDFPTTAPTIVKGAEAGITYASELFGDGSASLQLPSGTTTGVGKYAAVVYTVDGTISKKFDMTFTLTNGATFASAPILTMDKTTADTTIPTDGNGYVNQDYYAEDANIIVHPAVALPAVGDVVQFSGAAYLYSVIGTHAGTASTDNIIDIQRLGGSGGLASDLDADPYPASIYYLPANGVANASIGGVTPVMVASENLADPGANILTYAVAATPLRRTIVHNHW
jgi:hypothetical protein